MASSTMALARAFTKRTKRSLSHTAAHQPSREGSVRYPAGTVNRDLISLPTELISTTNVNALNYPDISTLNSVSSSNSSISSGNDSDFTTISRNFINSPATTPETSSAEISPISELTNTLSFFDTPHRAKTSAGIRPSSSHSSMDVPPVPKRALSHSKKAHEELAHKRSVSRMSPPPSSLAGPAVVRSSADIFSTTDPSHPFNKELTKVNEVAEEFGLVSTSLAKEEQDLIRRGLRKFGVEDYIEEIQGLYGGVFEDKLGPMANPWV
jgi:hypothetical protein